MDVWKKNQSNGTNLIIDWLTFDGHKNVFRNFRSDIQIIYELNSTKGQRWFDFQLDTKIIPTIQCIYALYDLNRIMIGKHLTITNKSKTEHDSKGQKNERGK